MAPKRKPGATGHKWEDLKFPSFFKAQYKENGPKGLLTTILGHQHPGLNGDGPVDLAAIFTMVQCPFVRELAEQGSEQDSMAKDGTAKKVKKQRSMPALVCPLPLCNEPKCQGPITYLKGHLENKKLHNLSEEQAQFWYNFALHAWKVVCGE